MANRFHFSAEFFERFPDGCSVRLPVAETATGRYKQIERRLSFIEEQLPHASFCAVTTSGRGGALETEFLFSTATDATYFLMGANDL